MHTRSLPWLAIASAVIAALSAPAASVVHAQAGVGAADQTTGLLTYLEENAKPRSAAGQGAEPHLPFSKGDWTPMLHIGGFVVAS